MNNSIAADAYDTWKTTPPDPKSPKCPICGSDDAEYFYFDKYHFVMGCDCCISKKRYDEMTEDDLDV